MAERKDHTADDRPFLSRWSERKRHAEPDRERDLPDTDAGQPEGADAETVDEELAANQAAAEAIDIDSLDADSDYSPFFKDGVPTALKSAALRQLWRSSPVFANIDGLNDYDEDFTIPKTPMGAIRTAWKFGRGFVTDNDTDNDEAAAEPDVVETGDGDEEAVAEAAAGEPAPVSDDDTKRDNDADAETAAATGTMPDPDPVPKIRLRDRLDMAAFSDRDDD